MSRDRIVADVADATGVADGVADATDVVGATGAADDRLVAQRFALGRRKKASEIAEQLLTEAGWVISRTDPRVRGAGVTFSFSAINDAGAAPTNAAANIAATAPTGTDADTTAPKGDAWWVDVAGTFNLVRPGLQAADVAHRTIAKAAALKAVEPDARLLVITPAMPRPTSELGKLLASVCPSVIDEIVVMGKAINPTSTEHQTSTRREAPRERACCPSPWIRSW